MPSKLSLLLTLAALHVLAASPAHAYIGPGGGLTAIGAVLALFAVVLVTFFGFLWYPVKRLRRKRRESARRAAAEAGRVLNKPAKP